MSFHAPARRAMRLHLQRIVPPPRRARAAVIRRPHVERLEERCMLSLLGLSQLATNPDIASGSRTSISYTQVGNNDNPFQYSAIPLSLKMPNGSMDTISNQANKVAAKTTLNIDLDNYGYLVSGASGSNFAINGHVVVNGTIYDGSLLTAQAQEFGFANTFTKADAEFDVRLVITGGMLTQAGGPFIVGDELGLLIHQPGLTISTFPTSFSISNSLLGSSDSAHLPPQIFCLSTRQPEPASTRPPLIGTNPSSPITEPPEESPAECTTCGQTCCSASSALSDSVSQDDGNGTVALYDGAVTMQTTDLTIDGRGIDYSLTWTYRSDVTGTGACCGGWEMSYNGRLVVVDSSNLAEYQAAFPTAKVGDVDEIDSSNRDDLYVLSGTSYISPAGYYSQLTKDPDGTYSERFDDGTVYTYSRPDAEGVATLRSESDASGDTMNFVYNDQEQLTTVYDTLGRPIQYSYNSSGQLTTVEDYLGRTVTFTYDAGGNMSSVTTPAVTGTPTGNNFPGGTTTRYTYDTSHRMTSVTAPNEVADGGPPRLQMTYDSSGRVTSLMEGGTNSSTVPAGGTITYTYQTLGTPTGPTDTTTPTRQTTVTDRNGNETIYQFNQLNNVLSIDQLNNRDIRSGDPSSYLTTFAYDTNYRMTQETLPAGNTFTYTYDSSNPDRFQQGNLLSVTETPDSTRGGDQSAITTTYTYEPIYDQVHTMTEPRGNDPTYVPQNGGTQSSARYTTTYTYDYQEGTNFSALGAILGISAAAVQARLAAAGIPMGLGDVNGDGLTNQVAGNLIRTQSPTVTLLPGSAEAAIEGTTSQPIVTLYTYNSFGQITSTTDPELNVTTYTYYPERNPAGTGVIFNPNGNATTGGYLDQTVEDSVAAPGRDSGTNPAPARITTTYAYDNVGNMTSQTDGRGIVTQYVYNQLNQVVEIIHAAQVPATSTKEPLPLTAFAYLERFFYDANGNVVLHQVEDRGNTSNVGFPPPAGSLPSYITNTEPAGGPTFDDTVTRYDILDDPVDTIAEVGGGQFLDTHYRYDPDQNLVLTIQPEGNATATIYDERNLVYRTINGVTTPPELQPGSPTNTAPTLLAPTDPTDYDVRGGTPSQSETYRYDTNGNMIESVDADDNDLSSANNDPTLGPGDRTRYVYDGFDRRTAVIDAVGDETVYQYDPDGNVIRTSQFGPVGGPSPTSDGTPGGLVSSLGVIQSANLVNSNLLAATETSYDELGRVIQTSQVLFVNTIPTSRTPDVAEGGSDVGLGNLTPGETQSIPGVSGVTILGRVSNQTDYDRDSRVTFTVQDDATATRTLYDGAGRTIETIDPAMNTVITAYDADSNVIETRETDVSQVLGVPNEIFLTTYFYDSLNRLQETVDNLGETTYDRYDSRNNLVAMADADGPAGPVISRRAFANGTLTVNTTNTFGNVTLYYFDGLDRKVREEQILTASGKGDGAHIGASIYGVKDTPPAPESFPPTPDTTQAGGDGIIRTGWNYDKDSLLSSMIDDDGNVTLYLYDDLNRQVAQSEGLVVGSTYTEANILGSRVIPTPTAATINNPSTIPNAEINSQLAEAQALIAAVASLFPTLANQVNDNPPTTKVWGFSPNDNVLIYQDENGTETFTKYDAIDRVIAVRDFRAGQHDSFAGDPIFAPAPVSIPAVPGSTTVVQGTTIQNFQYDGLSRMTSAFDNNDPTTASDDSTVTDAYDSLGRIIEEAQSIGGQPTQVISSAWRADNLRSALTYPNGRVEVYTYDDLEREKTVSDQGASQPIAVYDYMGVDRVIEQLYPQAGTFETYLNNAGTADIGYDGDRRPIEVRDLRSDNSLIVGFTYTYDRMGNKLTEGKLQDPKNSETYTYDSAYRLITFNRASGGIAPLQSSWTLDGVGNWIQVNGQSQQFSSTNELTQSAPAAGGPATILYDNNGNQTDDGTYLYTYDAENRLRTVTLKSSSALIAVYSYDALGRRIQKVVTNSGGSNGTTDYYLDGQQEIEEHNGAGTLTQQYVYGRGINEVLVMDRNLNGDATATGPGDQRLFYYQNALGSVFALTDNTGKILEAYQYDAYGRQTVFDPGPSGSVVFGAGDVVTPGGVSLVGNPFLFVGMRLDPETGLYYDQAREYNAVQGRFISRDPAGISYDAGNLGNGYTYAWNSPAAAEDTTGLLTWKVGDTVWSEGTSITNIYGRKVDFLPNDLAETSVNIDIGATCGCANNLNPFGNRTFIDYHVTIWAVVVVRPELEPVALAQWVKRAEGDHVTDFTTWMNGPAKAKAQATETTEVAKARSYWTKKGCAEREVAILAASMPASYSQALADTIRTWDTTGKHTYGGPNQRE
ncbi:MAG: RHS repeat-associated core domain-containing protein [Isosphaerales bacterium]